MPCPPRGGQARYATWELRCKALHLRYTTWELRCTVLYLRYTTRELRCTCLHLRGSRTWRVMSRMPCWLVGRPAGANPTATCASAPRGPRHCAAAPCRGCGARRRSSSVRPRRDGAPSLASQLETSRNSSAGSTPKASASLIKRGTVRMAVPFIGPHVASLLAVGRTATASRARLLSGE